jgi:hypothetical protein
MKKPLFVVRAGLLVSLLTLVLSCTTVADTSVPVEETAILNYAHRLKITNFNSRAVHWGKGKKVVIPAGDTRLAIDLKYKIVIPLLGSYAVAGTNIIMNYTFLPEREYRMTYEMKELDLFGDPDPVFVIIDRTANTEERIPITDDITVTIKG